MIDDASIHINLDQRHIHGYGAASNIMSPDHTVEAREIMLDDRDIIIQ